MRWPGHLVRGSSNDQMMFIADFYSTFITLAGADPNQLRPVDGMDMTGVILNGRPSPRDEIIFDVAGCVRQPSIRKGDYKLVGQELYNVRDDPYENNDIAKVRPDLVELLSKRLAEAAAERPPLPRMDILMSPALPWVYGERENASAPEWLKQHVLEVRKTQPKDWPNGTTPWPQAPKDGKIIYTGDGR